MANEFEKIMEFFTLPAEEKGDHLKDVFEESIEFFEKFKYTMQNGTPEEKQAMLDQVKKMQDKLQEETSKVKELTGLNDEELQAFANNKANFKDEDWEVIESAKNTIGQQADEISGILGTPKPGEKEAKKSTGPKKRKKKWVKS